MFPLCSYMVRIPIHDRQSRLRNLRDTPPGNVWMAKCRCGHLTPLPVAALIRRYGELFPIKAAMFHVRCSACGKSGTSETKLLRLCEPGCGRWRR